jgi:hypothetical protein
MGEKSILEQALLQVETLEEAVKANAKGILASTMKEELNDLLKEQEDLDPEEEEKDVEGVDAPEDDDTSITDEPEVDGEEPELDALDLDGEKEEDDLETPEEAADDDELLDMTGASEEEVLKVFKAMKPEDGIVVKKDGDTVAFSDEGNDYIIKLDDEEGEAVPELDSDETPELPDALNEESDEVVYEIELDEENEDDPFTEKPKKGEHSEDVNVTDTVGDGDPFDKKSEAQVGKGVKKLQANEQEGTKRPGTPVPGTGNPDTKEPGKGGGNAEHHENRDGTAPKGTKPAETKEPGKGGDSAEHAEDHPGTEPKGTKLGKTTEPDGEGDVSHAPEAKEELVKKETKEGMEECDECGEKMEETAEGEEKEVEAAESWRGISVPHGSKGASDHASEVAKSKKIFKAGSGDLNEQVETLKKQNGEYKKALLLFKDKLNEVALFNANLAHATRLFTEHSTTKQEKLNILKRFDSISTITESKNLYKSIASELETAKPLAETVVDKVVQTPQSSSTEVLSESKAYENPQFKRMKDLMAKLK